MAVMNLFQKSVIAIYYNNFSWFVFQILGICFAQNLRSDIEAQKAKWGLEQNRQ